MAETAELDDTEVDREARIFTDELNAQFDRTTKSQRLERSWRLNVAFLAGYQYHIQNTDGNLYFTAPAGSKFKAFSLHNFIRPYADRRATTYSSFRPRFKVLPRRQNQGDMQAADLSEMVLDYYWDHLRMDEMWRELCSWVVNTGNGFIQVLWDEEEGEFYSDTNEGGEAETYYEGDLRIEVVPPFQIDVDPFATRWQDVRVIRKRTRRSLSWIRKHFPDSGYDVHPRDGESNENYRVEDDLMNIVGPLGLYSAGRSGQGFEGAATVDEYWVKACPEFPRGRLIVRCGDKVLRDGPNPAPKGALPFVHFRDLMIPGRLWGQSIIESMIPLQRDYNRIRSKFIEHIVLLCNGKVVSPQAGGLIEAGFISDIELIEFQGLSAPQFLMPPPLPSDLDNTCATIQRDMDQITVDFGAGRGQYQGKLSGRALDLLVEQQMKNQVPTLQAFARGLEQVAALMLAALTKNVTDDRAIRIVGKKATSVKLWQGAQLEGGAEVHIEADSYIPKSRTLAISTVQTLLMSGGLNMQLPEDKALVYELLAIDREDELIAAKRVHIKAARLENALLAKGITIPPPTSYEDLDVHTETLNELLNSEEFKALPPEMQAPALMHHQQTMALAAPMAGVTMPPGMIEQTTAEGPDQQSARGGAAPPSAPASQPQEADMLSSGAYQ